MRKQDILNLAKKIKSRKKGKIISALTQFINQSEKFKNAYFWSPPSVAAARRSYEKSNSFSYSGKNYSISFTVSCSAKNIYITKKCIIYGQELTLRDAKKLLEILEGGE